MQKHYQTRHVKENSVIIRQFSEKSRLKEEKVSIHQRAEW